MIVSFTAAEAFLTFRPFSASRYLIRSDNRAKVLSYASQLLKRQRMLLMGKLMSSKSQKQ
ncbi:hypothetical protein BWD09_00650 [Neisseria dentiae]|uniref:Uncharacterized protein n=1 Tax=Neisseria dentiae TaxID=194197 RepID=A0A1X3DGF9_9NEIS|nr:hypothetical protein BWD09_00650 [Neisseria dentiae]